MIKKILLTTFLISIFSVIFIFSAYYNQIPRISYVKGNVQLEDVNGGWSNCDINLPITQGSRIVTGRDGRTEVEFDDGSALRVNSNSEFFISILNQDYVKLEAISGTYILKTISDMDFEIVTSVGNILVRTPSNVRIDIYRNGTLKIFVRDGRAYFKNEFIDKKIKSHRGLYISNGGSNYSKLYSLKLDDFDFWSDRRDSRYTYSQSRRYIPETNIYVGIYDLDHYGRWVFLNDYGYCWIPAIYDVEWAPYRYGYWRYCEPWGWTWISYEPWGWLPYHYGRWFFSVGYGWVWTPGRHWSISFWSPGLVRFSIWDNYIGWVPLGPGDYYCYDCGWNRNINIINNYTNINYYNLTNLHVRNAATIVNIDDFRHGRPIVRKNSVIEGSHRPVVSRSARIYNSDPSMVKKMFTRERIVRTRLKIKPVQPGHGGYGNSSNIRRGNYSLNPIRDHISRGRNSSTNFPLTPFNGRSEINRRNNIRNNAISADISRGRDLKNRSRNHYSNNRTRRNSNYGNNQRNHYGSNERDNSSRPTNPYGFHRNEGSRGGNNNIRKSRENIPHINSGGSRNYTIPNDRRRNFSSNTYHRPNGNYSPSYTIRRRDHLSNSISTHHQSYSIPRRNSSYHSGSGNFRSRNSYHSFHSSYPQRRNSSVRSSSHGGGNRTNNYKRRR